MFLIQMQYLLFMNRVAQYLGRIVIIKVHKQKAYLQDPTGASTEAGDKSPRVLKGTGPIFWKYCGNTNKQK